MPAGGGVCRFFGGEVGVARLTIELVTRSFGPQRDREAKGPARSWCSALPPRPWPRCRATEGRRCLAAACPASTWRALSELGGTSAPGWCPSIMKAVEIWLPVLAAVLIVGGHSLWRAASATPAPLTPVVIQFESPIPRVTIEHPPVVPDQGGRAGPFPLVDGVPFVAET
jgi:hypothetical protein